MVRTLLIGIGAGLVAALLFASILSGSALAIVLFYLAPLPIMIVALGWTHLSGLAAALVGSAILGVGLTPLIGVVFALAVALPAWFLAYLVMLGRASPAGQGQTEWYPLGRIVATAVIIGLGLAFLSIVALGPGADEFRTSIAAAVEAVIREQLGTPADSPLVLPDGRDGKPFTDFMAIVVPPAIIVFWIVTTLFNLWLAGRIVRTSGRLTRPWPDLAATRLPPLAAPALGLSVVASFLPAVIGLAGEFASSAFATAFMIVGFAAIHDTTRGASARPVVLGGLYVVCLVMSWVLVIVALFGLADHIFDLRARWASKGRPSNDNS
jgi:hypothetical protein